MPGRHIDSEMLEGASVEWLEVEAIEATPEKAETDWSRQRKTAPFNQLLPFTSLWAEDLPPQVRPMALMATFPRVANLVAANWKEPVAFRIYMQSLLADSRRGRRGFPSEIKEELVKLRMFYYFGSCLRTTGADGVASTSRAIAPRPERGNSKD